MEYERMFPAQHAEAQKQGVPLVLPVGNLEYHGQHSVCGTDTIITREIARKLERAAPQRIVLAPVFSYAPSSYAASGPEKGTMHLDMSLFQSYMTGMLRSLLEGGWRNLCILIHHQYDREMLFPLTLACLMAGKQTFFDLKEAHDGRGWFARAEDLRPVLAEMNAVKVFPIMSEEVQNEFGYDHAGKVECSLLAALCPDQELVWPEKADTSEWFTQTVREFSADYGERIATRCVDDLLSRILKE